jgi:hypothetical protein
MKTFTHLVFVLVVFSIAIVDSNAQPLFEVEREFFCKGVQDREPMNHFSNVAEIRHWRLLLEHQNSRHNS